MPPNPHGRLAPEANMTRRGEHPDLQGDSDVSMTARQRADADWDQRYAHDDTWRNNLEDELRNRMRRWPSDIRTRLEGKTFGGTPSQGFKAFDEARRQLGRESNTIFESDVKHMSPSDYERYFESGQVRRGYRFVMDTAQTTSDKTPLSAFVVDRRREAIPPAAADEL